MHGIIVFQYKKFIVENFGFDTWDEILRSIGARDRDIDFYHNMDDEVFFQVFGNTLKIIKMEAKDALEAFGEYIAGFLIKMYYDSVEKDWKTLEILEHTENVMHKSVRKSIIGEKASPPILIVNRLSDNEIELVYSSKKKLYHLGYGIIRGISKYYNESDKIKIDMNVTDETNVKFLISRTA